MIEIKNRKYCPQCRTKRKFSGKECSICGWHFIAYSPDCCHDTNPPRGMTQEDGDKYVDME